MDWLVIIGDTCLETLGWLLGMAAVFALLARLMPCNRGMFWWKDLRAACTDILYWLALPVFGRVGRTLLLVAGIALLFGRRAPGFAFVKDAPLWQQCAGVLVLQDFMLYWIHRGFHTRPAWGFHAVHHSPTVVDWISAARFHLVNILCGPILTDVVLLLIGFSPAALVALAPFNLIYSSMVHANLNWTFGPLRYVFASPVFHRWHHTSEADGINKNFASTFPVLDLVFGTFHMPAGKLPEQFGNGENDYPDDFWGQLLQPFRSRAASPARPDEMVPAQRDAA